ncbi:MAG: hypothetical protein GXP62_00300 [Oligoflexia bacterium]|nr:hypothetical protein [Oligoflexia bacterium]
MTTPQPGELDRRQHLEVLVADGVATSAQAAELGALGGDSDAFVHVRGLLAQILRPPTTVDLADDVMLALGLDTATAAARDVLVDALDPGLAPDLAPAVLQALGLPTDDVGELIHEALDAGDAPDLSDDVLAALGLSEDAVDGYSVSDALHDSLTTSPIALADDVMVALGIGGAARSKAATSRDSLAPLTPRRPRLAPPTRQLRPSASTPGMARWRFPAVAVAAAAALVLFFTVGPVGLAPDQQAFRLAAINHVHIEDLTAGDQVMVQVMQFDENAPTIIFIDDMSEDEGGIPL